MKFLMSLAFVGKVYDDRPFQYQALQVLEEYGFEWSNSGRPTDFHPEDLASLEITKNKQITYSSPYPYNEEVDYIHEVNSLNMLYEFLNEHKSKYEGDDNE